MMVMTRRFALFSALALPACSADPEIDVDRRPPLWTVSDATALSWAILALGDDVDPDEAARAGVASYHHARELAIEYQIVDPPLIHNTKVNLGLKPRGLCNHWAEDMETRLKSEGFQTLDIHRAIGGFLGVDHSTAIISRRGDSMYQGIVVDPWRKGGTLTWVRTDEDTKWGWEPRRYVLSRRAVYRDAETKRAERE